MFKVGDKVKLEDLPLVEVRDSEDDDWVKMYFLGNIEGANYPFKVLDMKGRANAFKQMRTLQEPEMRPMTDMEIIEALKKEGCALKDSSGNIWGHFPYPFNKEKFTLTRDAGETWGKLEVPND